MVDIVANNSSITSKPSVTKEETKEEPMTDIRDFGLVKKVQVARKPR